jgi:hypothetical protein
MIALFVILFWLSIFFLIQKPMKISTSELQLTYFKQTEIDVVLLEDSYEKLSTVLKFMPWARKVHIQTNVNPNPISQERVILFKQNLLHYSLTSPTLAQHFIVIESGFTLSNYLFPSQFFINKQPVIRMKNNVFGMTRTIFNENAFYEYDKSQQVLFAFKNAIKNRQILYKSYPLVHVQESNTMRDISNHDNIIHATAIIVSDSYLQDINMSNIQQIWIVIINKVEYSYQRLHFFQRVASVSGTIIEIIPKKNIESVIVEVIGKIKSVMLDNIRKSLNDGVHTVLTKPKFVFGPKELCIANNLANKISQVYDIGFTILEKNQRYNMDGTISNHNTISDMFEYDLRSKLLQK